MAKITKIHPLPFPKIHRAPVRRLPILDQALEIAAMMDAGDPKQQLLRDAAVHLRASIQIIAIIKKATHRQ